MALLHHGAALWRTAGGCSSSPRVPGCPVRLRSRRMASRNAKPGRRYGGGRTAAAHLAVQAQHQRYQQQQPRRIRRGAPGRGRAAGRAAACSIRGAGVGAGGRGRGRRRARRRRRRQRVARGGGRRGLELRLDPAYAGMLRRGAPVNEPGAGWNPRWQIFRRLLPWPPHGWRQQRHLACRNMHQARHNMCGPSYSRAHKGKRGCRVAWARKVHPVGSAEGTAGRARAALRGGEHGRAAASSGYHAHAQAAWAPLPAQRLQRVAQRGGAQPVPRDHPARAQLDTFARLCCWLSRRGWPGIAFELFHMGSQRRGAHAAPLGTPPLRSQHRVHVRAPPAAHRERLRPARCAPPPAQRAARRPPRERTRARAQPHTGCGWRRGAAPGPAGPRTRPAARPRPAPAPAAPRRAAAATRARPRAARAPAGARIL